MKLSELVERCKGTDPELMVTGEHGVPVPVVDIDEGFLIADLRVRIGTPYVELLAADEEDCA